MGRNDPCPCGSGKKYKKCCLNKDRENPMSFQPGSKIDIKELEELYNHHNQWLEDELEERTPGEVAYDDLLLSSLRDGKSIKEALQFALGFDNSNIKDIEEHYDYLLEHLEIKEKFRQTHRRDGHHL
jgi:hypothetical protein